MKSNTQETAPCLSSYTQPGMECSRTQTGTSAVGQGKTSRQVSSYFFHFTILDQVNIFFQKSLYSQPNLNRLFRKKDHLCQNPPSQISIPSLAHSSESVGLKTQSLCGFSGTPIANCRPMFPTVTPPEKNIHGSQERI